MVCFGYITRKISVRRSHSVSRIAVLHSDNSGYIVVTAEPLLHGRWGSELVLATRIPGILSFEIGIVDKQTVHADCGLQVILVMKRSVFLVRTGGAGKKTLIIYLEGTRVYKIVSRKSQFTDLHKHDCRIVVPSISYARLSGRILGVRK